MFALGCKETHKQVSKKNTEKQKAESGETEQLEKLIQQGRAENRRSREIAQWRSKEAKKQRSKETKLRKNKREGNAPACWSVSWMFL